MYRAAATLALLVAILCLGLHSIDFLTAHTAAQDGQAAASAETVEATSTPTPTATATSEPTATATSLLEPTIPPDPTAEEPLPTPEGTVESTATRTSDVADVTSILQPEYSVDAESEAPPLALSVAATEVSFGRVSTTGKLDPAIEGLTSEKDGSGAFYMLEGAIQVNVEAGASWTGACLAEENSGTAKTVSIAAGRLEWRLAGTEKWTSFSPSTSDPACFPSPGIGTQTFIYDLRLRVESNDPPGCFQTVLVFTVEP